LENNIIAYAHTSAKESQVLQSDLDALLARQRREIDGAPVLLLLILSRQNWSELSTFNASSMSKRAWN
jgi:hypothetical protein